MVTMKSRHIPGTLIALPNYERTIALRVVFPRREGSFSSISTQVNEEAKGGGGVGMEPGVLSVLTAWPKRTCSQKLVQT